MMVQPVVENGVLSQQQICVACQSAVVLNKAARDQAQRDCAELPFTMNSLIFMCDDCIPRMCCTSEMVH